MYRLVSQGLLEASQKEKDTTFPVLNFKNKFARSDSIELRVSRGSLKDYNIDSDRFARFHSIFFGFKEGEGIRICGALPLLSHSVRLQKLRGGFYYPIIHRLVNICRAKSKHVCAVDPGVRKFATIYDPSERTLTIKDAAKKIERRFETIDALNSKLARIVNECKSHSTKPELRQRKKHRRHGKTALHRKRYRLSCHIRYAHQRITRMVADAQHKLANWLAANYDEALCRFSTRRRWRKNGRSVTRRGMEKSRSQPTK